MFTCGPAFFGASSGADPHFANTVLLCHFDGANGQATTVDSSSRLHSVEGVTGLILSSEVSKFGATSSKFSGAGGGAAWTVPDGEDWNFGSGKFTVECWVYFITDPGTNAKAFVTQYNTTGNQRAWTLDFNAGALRFVYSTNGTAGVVISAPWDPVAGVWYHLAADKDDANLIRVYADGVVKASASAAVSFFNSTAQLQIGNSIFATRLDGYMDEVRITKGVARYAGAFTPPTTAFPNT